MMRMSMNCWTRRTAILGLLVISLLPLARGEAARGHTVPANILLLALGSEPNTFDPAQDVANGSQEYYGTAYEGLTAYVGSTTRVGPGLAKSWDVSSDGRVYTFHLRPGVTFADGTPFDAEAVKFNIQRMQHINQGYVYLVKRVTRVDVLDKLTVRMTLSGRYPPFLSGLAYGYGTSMVSPTGVKQHQVKGDWGAAWFNEHTDGTGPYQLQSWVHNQQAIWVKNPRYWRGWSGKHFDQIIFKIVKEASTQKLLLRQGDADVLLYALTPNEAVALEGQPGITVHSNHSFDVYYLGLNVTQKPLNDVRVRQALAYAMDYNAVIQAAAKGHAQQPHGFTPQGLEPYDASLPLYHYDLNKARQLLAQAGYPHGGFTLHAIWATGYLTHALYEQILQSALAKLGVNMTLQEVTIPNWVSIGTDPKRVQIWDTEWYPSVADPSDYLVGLMACSTRGSAGANWNYYCNPTFDSLVQRAVSSTSKSERAKLYSQANRILLHDMPMIPIYQGDQIIPMRSSVQGYVFNPVNLINFNFYDMYKA